MIAQKILLPIRRPLKSDPASLSATVVRLGLIDRWIQVVDRVRPFAEDPWWPKLGATTSFSPRLPVCSQSLSNIRLLLAAAAAAALELLDTD